MGGLARVCLCTLQSSAVQLNGVPAEVTEWYLACLQYIYACIYLSHFCFSKDLDIKTNDTMEGRGYGYVDGR
ncbi:hypothetical protein FKM82_006117 [Ascaphus truei]